MSNETSDKWEYLIADFAQGAMMSTYLNPFGQDGWELVMVAREDRPDYCYRVWFKRRVNEQRKDSPS